MAAPSGSDLKRLWLGHLSKPSLPSHCASTKGAAQGSKHKTKLFPNFYNWQQKKQLTDYLLDTCENTLKGYLGMGKDQNALQPNGNNCFSVLKLV